MHPGGKPEWVGALERRLDRLEGQLTDEDTSAGDEGDFIDRLARAREAGLLGSQTDDEPGGREILEAIRQSAEATLDALTVVQQDAGGGPGEATLEMLQRVEEQNRQLAEKVAREEARRQEAERWQGEVSQRERELRELEAEKARAGGEISDDVRVLEKSLDTFTDLAKDTLDRQDKRVNLLVEHAPSLMRAFGNAPAYVDEPVNDKVWQDISETLEAPPEAPTVHVVQPEPTPGSSEETQASPGPSDDADVSASPPERREVQTTDPATREVDDLTEREKMYRDAGLDPDVPPDNGEEGEDADADRDPVPQEVDPEPIAEDAGESGAEFGLSAALDDAADTEG